MILKGSSYFYRNNEFVACGLDATFIKLYIINLL